MTGTQPDTNSDEALVAAARGADERAGAAFGALVVRYQEWLVRLLEYLLGNKADADDVAQEVFVRAFKALPGYRGEAGFRGWLRVIATRQAFNYRRDAGVRRRHVAAVEIEPFVRNGSGPVMEREAIAKVLDLIAYPYREILILRHVEDLSLQEIGVMLDLGASATKMRLSRARAVFWEAYQQLVGHTDAE